MIDAMYQEGTDAALNDQVSRPAPLRPADPPFKLRDLAAAPFQGIGGGVSKSIAFGAEVTGAFGEVLGAAGTDGAGGMFSVQSPQERQQSERARSVVLKNGPEMSNAAGDLFRARAAEILPNPQTTHASAQVVAGLTDFATRAVGYTMTLGPVAPLAMGGDAGLEEADRLKQMGVDKATRTKAGAVAGVLNAAAVAVPMTGATPLIRAGKGIAVGEGTIVGQSLAERAILRAAGYDKIADTFDPLDPVALTLGAVPGALGAKFGHAAAKPPAAGVPKPLLEMGLGERQALRYDDVRLDAYAVEAAKREGIPPELLLAVKNAGEKSGPAATSPKGARGVMQFMPDTWKQYGRGDPADPINSIDAGAKYLHSLHDAYGSWDAAVAHYNGGGAQAAIVRGGGRPTFKETAAYLDRVREYMGKAADENVVAAARVEPDLVPAARVALAAEAIDATRLTPDTDLAGRDAHVSAVELAADQLGRGEPVAVADRLQVLDAPQEAGTVRLYAPAEAADKPVRLSTDLAAVEALARDAGTGVHYIDLPADHPAITRAAEPAARDVPGAVPEIPGAVAHATAEVPPELGATLLQPLRADRAPRTAAAAEQLRATRAEVTNPAPSRANSSQTAAAPSGSKRAKNGEKATKPETSAAGGETKAAGEAAGGPQAASGGSAEGHAPATVARAAAEAAQLDPDMLVQLEGMDAPVKVGELLARIKEEAAQDVRDGRLVEVAAACDLRA